MNHYYLFLMLLFLCNSCDKNDDEATLSSNKVKWLQEAFNTIKADTSIKAVGYWNEKWEAEKTVDMRITSSTAVTTAFQNAIQDSHFVTASQVENGKIMPPIQGTYFNFFPGIDLNQETLTFGQQTIQDFETTAGQSVAWVTCGSVWENGIEFPTQAVDLLAENGKTPFMYLEPWSETTSFINEADPVYNMAAILNGTFDEELKALALAAKTSAVPMVMVFGGEVNGDWFPWNGRWNGAGETTDYGDTNYPDGPERFRDAYRHIIDIFNLEEVNNVTWGFHIDASSSPDVDWNQAKWYYPGDDYIDWIGASVYGAQHNKDENPYTFAEIWTATKTQLLQVSTTKPFAIFEMGVGEF